MHEKYVIYARQSEHAEVEIRKMKPKQFDRKRKSAA